MAAEAGETALRVAIQAVAAGTNPVAAVGTRTAAGNQIFLPNRYQFLPLGPVPFQRGLGHFLVCPPSTIVYIINVIGTSRKEPVGGVQS